MVVGLISLTDWTLKLLVTVLTEKCDLSTWCTGPTLMHTRACTHTQYYTFTGISITSNVMTFYTHHTVMYVYSSQWLWSTGFIAHALSTHGQQYYTYANIPSQRWSNRTCVLVLVLKYEYFLSTRTRTRVRRKVIVLEFITKVIVLTITSHDYIFFIWTAASKYIRQIKMAIWEVI